MSSPVIAVIFDFDDTLLPDSTSQFLRSRGVDVEDFWAKARDLVGGGYDETLSWLKLFLDIIGNGKPLGKLTNAELQKFGAKLDRTYFPGIPRLFVDLKKQVQRAKGVTLEFYIVSGGLKPIIMGSKVVRTFFDGVYACEYGEDRRGVIDSIKRVVSFTEKTRYIFEINKGVNHNPQGDPQQVNRNVPVGSRRVPLKNMIYVGDGLTDIPCFSVVGKGTAEEPGGTVFGIFDPAREEKAKRAYREFLKARRVEGIYSARYGAGANADLGNLIRLAVATLCAQLKLDAGEIRTIPDPPTAPAPKATRTRTQRRRRLSAGKARSKILPRSKTLRAVKNP